MTLLKTTLNGLAVDADVPDNTTLLEWLRGAQGLTGTHAGCDTSQCGACTVLLEGVSVKSCAVLAVQAQGQHITTIEGVATQVDGKTQLHPVQQAFVNNHGLQCGFCTPGMVMSALCLLRETPLPSDAQITDALEGNLCRCTGYVNIVAAVREASVAMKGSHA